jgi:hypothetical protein
VQVALDLQRKSDAKQRKLESTMELAADHSKNTGSNSTDSDRGRGPAAYFRKRKNKKSLRSNEAGEKHKRHSRRPEIRHPYFIL